MTKKLALISRLSKIIFKKKMSKYGISNLILFIITFLTSILIYYWKNWLILVILAYLWYITLKENKVSKMKMKLYEALEKL